MNPTRLVLTASSCLALLTLTAAVAGAGPILLPGQWQSGQYVADADAKTPFYALRYSTITATVEGDEAAVRVQETIEGPGQAVECVCLIPLPPGARANGVVVAAGIPNGDHAVLSGARYLPPDAAQRIYESAARQLDSVAILAFSGRPAVLVPKLEIRGKLEIVADFRQPLAERQGVTWLRLPTPAVAFSTEPVARLSIATTVAGKEPAPLRAVFSPTHEAEVERDGLYRAKVRVKADNYTGQEDFRLAWVADADPLGLRVLGYREADEDDGYFMLLGNPTGSASEEKVLDKDLVFVLDTSGSMRGEKIEQARAAIDYCIEHLNPGDRFNIVTFGTDVASFRDAPVPRDEKTLAAAREYIEGVIAQGRTNIGGALTQALEGEAVPGRPRITIFLTDGTPTAGELVPEKILESVETLKPCPTRIFVMGVGHDVNTHLLDRLAEATEGSSQYVLPEEDIDAKIAALYDRLSHPVLTQVAIDFGELKTHSVYPRKLPALFKGSEVMIFGRYREGGRIGVTVSGTLAGEPVTYRCDAVLPKKPDGAEHEFVAPLWAARKIGYLLQEIRLHGENEELIAEVVKLSRKFGIVTEYTEFLAMTDNEISTEAAVNEANRLVNMANAQKAGQWAFNQARNDLELQNRKVAAQGANNYRDRLGRVVFNDAVRQIGSQTFYLRDGQWVDAEEAGERNRRVVQLHSDEYNDLVRNNARFARAQQLGWAMELNVGDERIVVEKDGQVKSEELREVRARQFEDRQFQQRMMLQRGEQLQQQNLRQQINQIQQFNQMPQQQFRNDAINRQQIQQQLPVPQEQVDQVQQLEQQQDFQLRRRNELQRDLQEKER